MAILDLVRRTAPFVMVLGLGVWLWTVANEFAITTTLGRAGPDLWPKLILLLLIGAAIWGIVESARGSSQLDHKNNSMTNAAGIARHEVDPREDLAGEADEVKKRPVFAMLGIASMLSYVVVIHHLGFLISTFLLLLAVMMFAGYQHWVRATIISAIGSLVFFVVFQRLVYVSLPIGAGPFRELTLAMMSLLGVR